MQGQTRGRKDKAGYSAFAQRNETAEEIVKRIAMKPRCLLQHMMLVAVWYAGCVAANSATTYCKTELTTSAVAGGAQKQQPDFLGALDVRH